VDGFARRLAQGSCHGRN